MDYHRLTNRELDILQILWESEHPLLASEIQKERSELNINTIQSILRKLSAYEMIHVADIIQTGTVFGRTYEPSISYEQYILTEFRYIFPEYKKRQNALMTALLLDSRNPDETLESLNKLITEYRGAFTSDH